MDRAVAVPKKPAVIFLDTALKRVFFIVLSFLFLSGINDLYRMNSLAAAQIPLGSMQNSRHGMSFAQVIISYNERVFSIVLRVNALLESHRKFLWTRRSEGQKQPLDKALQNISNKN